MTTSIKRRVLGATGAAALVAAGLTTAIAAAPSASADSNPSVKLNYNCTVDIFQTKIPQGVWSVTVTAGIPASVPLGSAIPAPKLSASVETNTSSGDTLRYLHITSLSGTSTAHYTFGGKEQKAQLTIPSTPIPASGGVTTVATGTGEAATAPTTAGPVVAKVGNFTGTLYYVSNGITGKMGLYCTLVPHQNTTLATVYVGSSAPTSSASPSSSSSAPTSSPTGTSGTATAPSTTTGPAVVTDGGSSGGDSNALVAAGAAAVAIGAGAGALGLRRRMRG